jgi:hypothetical protein
MKRKLIQHIGTEDHPVRISSMPIWSSCPGFAAMRELLPDDFGVAAMCGTAAGRAIELWHLGWDPADALAQALSENPQLGRAEHDRLAHVVECYAADERNQAGSSFGEVVAELQECEISFEWEGVHFSGHPDQARMLGDKLYIWDLKLSKFGGRQLTMDYAAQLAGYTVGLRRQFPNVECGGIVRLSGYEMKRKSSTEDVFFNLALPYEMCEAIVDQVARGVKRTRRGLVELRPCSRCFYCPGSGPDNCQRVLIELLKSRCTVCGRPNCRRKSCKEAQRVAEETLLRGDWSVL